MIGIFLITLWTLKYYLEIEQIIKEEIVDRFQY
jgi:hypothetical protein